MTRCSRRLGRRRRSGRRRWNSRRTPAKLLFSSLVMVQVGVQIPFLLATSSSAYCRTLIKGRSEHGHPAGPPPGGTGGAVVAATAAAAARARGPLAAVRPGPEQHRPFRKCGRAGRCRGRLRPRTLKSIVNHLPHRRKGARSVCYCASASCCATRSQAAPPILQCRESGGVRAMFAHAFRKSSCLFFRNGARRISILEPFVSPTAASGRHTYEAAVG